MLVDPLLDLFVGWRRKVGTKKSSRAGQRVAGRGLERLRVKLVKDLMSQSDAIFRRPRLDFVDEAVDLLFSGHCDVQLYRSAAVK